MLFSSITFLFMFLPIVMAVYYLVPNGAKISSCFWRVCFLRMGRAGLCRAHDLIHRIKLFCGRDIEANADNPKKAKLSLVFALTANILILGFLNIMAFCLIQLIPFLRRTFLTECSLCRSESHSIRFRRSHM